MFLIQPIFGFIVHRNFQKTGLPSFYTALHVWYGRILILLGMINGGLGLQLANNTSMGIRGLYAAIVVCVVLAYVLAQVRWYRIRELVKEKDRAQTKQEQNEQGESKV
jgi:sulfite exporter TauE/SafE